MRLLSTLRKNLDEAAGEIDEIDRMFGNYSVSSHLSDDFYSNKIAFAIALNFPYYTLDEKEKLGPAWSRDEWAMARLGDHVRFKGSCRTQPGSEHCNRKCRNVYCRI